MAGGTHHKAQTKQRVFMEEKDNKIKTVHRKTEKTDEHFKLTIIVIINMEKKNLQ
jgi:hypothetical protein